jgi:hypothetical protein
VTFWLVLVVRLRRYEPAARLAGSFATTTWFVADTRTSAALFSVTVGAAVAGWKLLPLIVT